MDKDEHLRQELDEFKKEKERIRNIVGEIGGKNNKQHKVVSLIFVILIGVLLILGVVLQKITLFLTLEIVVVLGVFKLIWMFYESQRASHFQFWILNSLEFRLNEMDRKVRRIEKMLKEEKEQ
jgi:Flp pilus assembly protein TadB